MASFDFPLPLPSIHPGNRKGRNPKEGYERGWSLAFTALGARIREDATYTRALALAADRTLVSEERLMNLYLLIRFYLPRLARGNIIEFGTYRGGSAIFMAALAQEFLPGVDVFGLDTFTGMPETDKGVDLHSAGDFQNDVSIDEIRHAVAAAGLTNLHLVQGLFAETGPATMRDARRFALAHIDCDIYGAALDAWTVTKPYLVPGAYIAFDDATQGSCLGATEMVEEIMIRREGLSSEQIYPHFVFRYPVLI